MCGDSVEMEEQIGLGSAGVNLGPSAAVTVKLVAVKETLREILMEIPGFRTLAERGSYVLIPERL